MLDPPPIGAYVINGRPLIKIRPPLRNEHKHVWFVLSNCAPIKGMAPVYRRTCDCENVVTEESFSMDIGLPLLRF